MLYPNVEELRTRYLDIMADPEFQAELQAAAARLRGPAHAAV